MIDFIYHEKILNEIATYKRRFHMINDAFKIYERLCKIQFNPVNPEKIIAPSKLHRIHQNELWTLYKVELSIPRSGLRPNQCPRVWFAVKGVIIIFLCMATHSDNYNDEKMNNVAFSRVTDFL